MSETIPGIISTQFTNLQFETPMTPQYDELTVKEFRILRHRIGVNGMKFLLIYERLLLEPELVGLVSKTVDTMFDMVLEELRNQGDEHKAESLRDQLRELAEDDEE